MQQHTGLALNAAAWFFVGKVDEVGTQQNFPIHTPFRIGRKIGLDLQLHCASVSAVHAEIFEENGQLWVRDLDSTNGTFVNGNRIRHKTRLVENDTIQFGTSVFHIARDSEPVSSPVVGNPTPESTLESERFERLLSGGVVPFFQPIVQLTSEDDVIGYEVLGRSRLFGLHTPAQMFAAASQLEMEAELSRVLRKQGLHVADKNLDKKFLLFVNTHPAELATQGIEESLFEIRDAHPNRPIMLEVHESMLNKSQQLVELRSALQSLNIQLAFHDFGGGKIRLAELGDVCPDIVKFDIKLLQGIDNASSRRQQLVASMVRMVSDLGITPMAECIEKQGEDETLRQLGFKLGQGFFYGRPSSIADCDGTVTRNALKSEPVPQVKTFLDDPNQSRAFVKSESVESGKPKSADWLLEQPPHHYTIQVLSAISEDRALAHVAMQDQPEKFAIFSKQGKTRMLYIVVYGVFEDRAAAKAASGRMANSAVSPWIRLLSSVHAEIESCE